jgi:hypothetical protein
VAALRVAGAEVLTVRLPDPGQMFGLPGALARPLARRMRAVNAVVDEVARRYGTVHLDVARDPATYERRYWSVDRLHPNEPGSGPGGPGGARVARPRPRAGTGNYGDFGNYGTEISGTGKYWFGKY